MTLPTQQPGIASVSDSWSSPDGLGICDSVKILWYILVSWEELAIYHSEKKKLDSPLGGRPPTNTLKSIIQAIACADHL